MNGPHLDQSIKGETRPPGQHGGAAKPFPRGEMNRGEEREVLGQPKHLPSQLTLGDGVAN